VKSSYKIRYLKIKINEKKDIPPSMQRLFLYGKSLDDSRTFSDYNIQKDTTIHLVINSNISIKKMKIFIETTYNKTLSLNVKSTDTIKKIKEMIRDYEGVALYRHGLSLNGKILEDYNELSDYNIQNRSTLNLVALSKFFIKISKGRVITLEVQSDKRIRNVKAIIQEKEGIPMDQQYLYFDGQLLKNDKSLHDYNIYDDFTIRLISLMKINIKFSNGKIIPLTVKSLDTIESIKKQIQRMEGILPDQQHLYYDDHNKELKNHQTLSYYNISDKSMLNLDVTSDKDMKIFVKTPTDKIYMFSVKSSDTMDRIKYKIEEKMGYLGEEQHLYYGNLELENNSTFSNYNIQQESILSLVLNKSIKNELETNNNIIEIFVKTTDKKIIPLKVKLTDTIKKIKYKIQDLEGISPNHQFILIDNNKCLKYLKDSQTLSYYNIQEKEVLNLYSFYGNKLPIFIRTFRGRIFILECKPTDTIEIVKKKIKEREGIPLDHQYLVFNNNQLKNDSTLSDYNIKKGSIIHFILRIRY